MLWQGSLATVPPGWALCDGTNATPNLRDRFLTPSGTAYAPDDTGGAPQHAHALTTDNHIHNFPAGSAIFNPPSGPSPPSGFAGNANDTATTSATNHLPPYYSLAYIMYLGT